MEILVVKMSALGDVIQALPVIPALKQAFPEARLHWLVEEEAEPILRSHSGVDRVLVSRRRGWARELRNPSQWASALRGVGELVSQLRGIRYDIAVDLQGLLKSGLWMGLAPARRKVGFNGTREGSHLFLTERVPVAYPDMHAVERYLSLVEAIGGVTNRVDFGLIPSEEARGRLRGLLQEAGWEPGTPYVVLVPGARWATKRWGEVSFAQVADGLHRTLGLRVAITGVSADRPLARRILQGMREQALDLTGRTDLPALMALLAGAKAVVSTDSGPMHLAAALGTPAVCLFGPTAPWRTGPYGRGHRVIRAAVSCSPCFRRQCPHPICMDRIRPEEVEEAVGEVVKAEPRSWS